MPFGLDPTFLYQWHFFGLMSRRNNGFSEHIMILFRTNELSYQWQLMTHFFAPKVFGQMTLFRTDEFCGPMSHRTNEPSSRSRADIILVIKMNRPAAARETRLDSSRRINRCYALVDTTGISTGLLVGILAWRWFSLAIKLVLRVSTLTGNFISH